MSGKQYFGMYLAFLVVNRYCKGIFMMESLHTRVMAIDGGGTRCRLALRTGRDVVSVETGSANVSTDFAGGVRQIIKGIDALAAKVGESAEALSALPAFVGLAGVTGPEITQRLRQALPFAHLLIKDDRPAALRGALGERDGVIAHCGTGSFFGSRIAGMMRFSGGWGSVLGDEASAQWIGRAALKATLRAVDGRLKPSGLSQMLLDRLDGAAGIVRFAGSADPKDFGALAPLVTAQAAAGDALGRRIMAEGATDIAQSLPAIGWAPGLTICLTGGIGPHFEPYLPAAMQADVSASVGEPLAGALLLAGEFAREIAQ